MADLARGVPVERQERILPAHPATVIGHADLGLPPVAEGDVDPARPRVEGVLHQLLHHGGGPLHDLTGRDLVRNVIGKNLDPRVHPGRVIPVR